jgi:glycosyltransferase involved in cell wall biosynthesis
MKIVLATGIYPPDIGGPATYVEKLAAEFKKGGHQVWVITYQSVFSDPDAKAVEWPIIRVAKHGGPWLRWRRFAAALREHASDADVVIAFSSVSCGLPLRMAKLKKPKKILRLGGDFFWERYTSLHGTLDLREWHAGTRGTNQKENMRLRLTRTMNRHMMPGLLRAFDHVVYSTAYQQSIHESYYKTLPRHSVIENALPGGTPTRHAAHDPLRLLYLGRFVGFKNIPSLVAAMTQLPDATLLLTGEGPECEFITQEIARLGLGECVKVQPPVFGDDKRACFDDHDLMVIPSLTEISPNAALEARSAGLPVLLTRETGLSDQLTVGMIKADLRTPDAIATAARSATQQYGTLAEQAAAPLQRRDWNTVAGEWTTLFSSFS